MNNYYITTPIYYVNDKPHIGHAYTSLACDILARFKRLDGFNVHFLTGTDEHGQKVEKSAQAKNTNPQEFTDTVSQNFRDLMVLMNFSNDDFIRTTENRHKQACQKLWQVLEKNKHIYLDKYSGWYSVRDEAYYGENELIEKDGKKLAPTGAEVECVEEESYFFDLSKWQDKLLKLYDENPDFIAPKSRRNEVISFVKDGLKDLSISRTAFSWGVKVPNNDKHIMYVWVDALTNYLTALGYPDENNEKFKQYWGADLHMIGKDIIRFHAVYWPALLMASGLELPKRIFAHGWWTNEGEKISKSLGNVIDPVDLVETYGLDQTRYFLMREISFGNDGDFSKQTMISRTNSDLANDIGNFCQRSLSMVFKNCEGVMPNPNLNDGDNEIINKAKQCLETIRLHLDKQEFNKALESIWKIVGQANKYVDDNAPWALKNTYLDRMGTVLYTCSELIRIFGILLQPFIPNSASKMLDLVSIPNDQRSFTNINDSLQSGIKIDKPQVIFPRYVEQDNE